VFVGSLSLSLSLLASPARAWESSSQQPPGEAGPETLQSLEQRVAELEQRLAELQELKIRPRTLVSVTGYADLGFFVPEGDGSGFRWDVGHTYFPNESGYGWVFYGDILATPVNTRGDPADLGVAPGVVRYDSVHSQGHASFIANELNLGINVGLTEKALLTGSINFTPRTGSDFSFGDSFDVDIVQLEYLPTRNLSFWVGKFDSVLGIEYRERKAPKRFGITPSLIARYTTGTALGVKGRVKLFNGAIVLATAVTNGSFTTENFHFYNEIDANDNKTVSGRLSVRLPFLETAEVGASGSFGNQDRAPDGTGDEWFFGVDLIVAQGPLQIKGQFLTGNSDGDPVSRAYSLKLHSGGYLEIDYMVTEVIGLLARGEWRDARVALVMERLYLTKSWRATGGLRLAFTDNILFKAEYLYNGEYFGGNVPDVPNNLFTSSLVLVY